MRNCVPVLAAATFYLRRFDAIASLDLSVEARYTICRSCSFEVEECSPM